MIQLNFGCELRNPCGYTAFHRVFKPLSGNLNPMTPESLQEMMKQFLRKEDVRGLATLVFAGNGRSGGLEVVNLDTSQIARPFSEGFGGYGGCLVGAYAAQISSQYPVRPLNLITDLQLECCERKAKGVHQF
jgi:hypothetical protein